MYKVTKSVMLVLGVMTYAMMVTLKQFTNGFKNFVFSKSKANDFTLMALKNF